MFRTILAALTFSLVAGASTITFVTPGGSTLGGQAVGGSATLTTGAGTVTIDLFNTLTAAQQVDAGQLLSDLSFTLSGTFATGLVNDGNRTYSGTLISVGAGGAVTPGSGTFNGWDFTNTGSTFLLEDLGSLAGPAQTIIGGTTATTTFANANGSIANNGPHNPFLVGDVHYVLTIAGVTAATNVTGATFSFGTTTGNNVPGGNVPEPISSALVGTGLISLFFLRRRIAR